MGNRFDRRIVGIQYTPMALFYQTLHKPMARNLWKIAPRTGTTRNKAHKIMESYLVGKCRSGDSARLAYLLIVDLFYVGFLRNTDDGTTHLAIPICGFVLAAEGWCG